MSAALTLAGPEHLDRLLPLVAACHAETGIESDAAGRQDGLAPLLEGSSHGAAYLVGPPRAPIGYIVITFGWSVEYAGLDGFIDEFYIRPGVRRRGIGASVLETLPRALAGAGLRALHLELERGNDSARRLYERHGFATRDRYYLMTRRFSAPISTS